MARRRKYDDDLKQPTRSSPYQDIQDDDYDVDYEDNAPENDYDDGYDGEDDAQPARFGLDLLRSTPAKILVAIIALLIVVLIALLIVRTFMSKDTQTDDLPGSAPATTETAQPIETAESSEAPAVWSETPAPSQPPTIVFMPNTQGTQNTEAPQTATATPPSTETDINAVGTEQSPTPVATETPEPTATPTPLPIILTNTPTPSPVPTPSPTPSPSPEPTPSPTPTASPVPDLATGVTNRDANLRESASSTAKIKRSVDKGEALTIHGSTLDSNDKVWYYLTVDDISTSGWMRDYVVDVKGELTAPTPTPNASSSPAAGAEDTQTSDGTSIGTATTNRAANLRESVNGAVITQLKKGSTVTLQSSTKDSSGNVWYEVRTGTTVGYMRDYVLDLDDDTAASASSTTSTQENLLDREVVGKVTTNRAANVREKPSSSAKVVRQLSQGNKLNVLGRYEGADGEIWYEVVTTSGKTYGFVRDYVVYVTEMNRDLETQTYTP
ncbi:MAG TPA: SH3 domain-containing protein [Candidatus Ventricola gallistercoris]|nr:SH3 domain-containing protein [Candidatus Ventricola gallistercoris]